MNRPSALDSRRRLLFGSGGSATAPAAEAPIATPANVGGALPAFLGRQLAGNRPENRRIALLRFGQTNFALVLGVSGLACGLFARLRPTGDPAVLVIFGGGVALGARGVFCECDRLGFGRFRLLLEGDHLLVVYFCVFFKCDRPGEDADGRVVFRGKVDRLVEQRARGRFRLIRKRQRRDLDRRCSKRGLFGVGDHNQGRRRRRQCLAQGVLLIAQRATDQRGRANAVGNGDRFLTLWAIGCERHRLALLFRESLKCNPELPAKPPDSEDFPVVPPPIRRVG